MKKLDKNTTQGVVGLNEKKMYKSTEHSARYILLNKGKFLINENCESGRGCEFDCGI